MMSNDDLTLENMDASYVFSCMLQIIIFEILAELTVPVKSIESLINASIFLKFS